MRESDFYRMTPREAYDQLLAADNRAEVESRKMALVGGYLGSMLGKSSARSHINTLMTALGVSNAKGGGKYSHDDYRALKAKFGATAPVTKRSRAGK